MQFIFTFFYISKNMRYVPLLRITDARFFCSSCSLLNGYKRLMPNQNTEDSLIRP